MENIIEQISIELKQMLNNKRYIHTKSVMYTAAALAMRYACDINKALLAGLLHDCAKCISDEESIILCLNNDITITDVERRNPFLLHAKVGKFIASDKFNISDSDILSAILYHTTGKPEMTLLEQIIFVADYIEPYRDKAKNLEDIRKMAFIDINKATAMILRDTLVYLKEKCKDIDPATEVSYDYYKKFL